MNTTIPSVFSFNASEVRTVIVDGEPWFSAADVCSVLGVKNHRDALMHLDADEKGVVSSDTPGGIQQISIINESGLYALVLRSRKPEAKPFIKWVTKEVLPAIRKTGQYVAAPYSASPGDALTKEQADALRQIITRAAEKLPEEKRGAFIRAGWSKLKSHFKVGYRQIPATEFTEAVSLITRHAVEGEYLPHEEIRETESVNQTVHKWAQQIRENNSYPVQVFAPLVDALLGRAGMQLMMPPVQQAEISERLGRVINIFHPMSSQFADAQGVLRCLKGLHPETGEKHSGFRQLIAA